MSTQTTGDLHLMANENSLESVKHNKTSLLASEAETLLQQGGTSVQPTESETGTQVQVCETDMQPISDPSDKSGPQPLGTTLPNANPDSTSDGQHTTYVDNKPSCDPGELAPDSDVQNPADVINDAAGNLDSNYGQAMMMVDQEVAGGTTCVSPKRDRQDTSKIDRSKQTDLASTAHQDSVQCMECHIIFSDPKSKERHLKLNHREKHATLECKEQMSNPGGMGPTSELKSSVDVLRDTEGDQDSTGIRQDMVKVDERVEADKRKCIPPKKDRLDPLKMDMSKPVVMPLTSSQLSLQCIECHIIFSDHKSKERHLKLNHPAEYEHFILRNALFACYVCDRQFTNSTDLMIHQKAHTERQPFKCPICGQGFNRSSELTHHKKIHFGQDGYACADCGKPCKTLTLLKYHRRTHTGERPYVCRECGKRFSMSKALQKHTELHAAEKSGVINADPATKNNGKSTIKYPCSVCEGTFKTTKTRMRHMKNKHNLCPTSTSNTLVVGQQVKQNVPIITPTSICQSTLLQIEPLGPLQQVNANIDTEQICKLIESLGNVQKVNQVVILGQVPPHAAPLNIQQIPGLGEPIQLNLNPQQMNMIELKQTGDLKTVGLEHVTNPCASLEQTIILEPITPDEQLENNPLAHTQQDAQIPPEHIEITLVPEQAQSHEEQQIPNPLCHPQTDSMDSMVCQNTGSELKDDSEQTIILELTSALIPTNELELSQPVPQPEEPTSSLVPTVELETTCGQNVICEEETEVSAPSLIPTVQMETHLQADQSDLSSSPFVPADTFTQNVSGQSQTHVEGETNSQVEAMKIDAVPAVAEEVSLEETHKMVQEEPVVKSLVEAQGSRKKSEKSCRLEDLIVKEQAPSQLDAKQVHPLPISVMSAQELVKVRKRKPARIFVLENMQQSTSKTQGDGSHLGEKLAKRQRNSPNVKEKQPKKHLVVKFGPKNKENKSKKQKKAPQPSPVSQEEVTQDKALITNLSDKKVPLINKSKKAKKDKKRHEVAETSTQSTPPIPDLQVQQHEEEPRKKKMKKIGKDIEPISELEITLSPIQKKKQRKTVQTNQPKKTKEGKLANKGRKTKLTKQQRKNVEASTGSANMAGQQLTQDSLLLLKGHKQPQLKVYKIDVSKSPGQTQVPPNESQATSQLSKTVTLKRKKKDPNSEPPNMSSSVGEKKVGRPKKNQKVLSKLAPLLMPSQPPETRTPKAKTTRKRKASPKVETEGVISSQRNLECKDCGEKFPDVSTLQRHKASMHITESPGLTYTNGNIFEGVSRIHLSQPQQMINKVIGVMNATADWDTETEMGEIALEEREGRVSFPALNPSPSFPLATSGSEVIEYDEKNGTTNATDVRTFTEIAKQPPQQSTQCLSPLPVQLPVKIKTLLPDSQPPHFTSATPFDGHHQAKGVEMGVPLASEDGKPECEESEVQAAPDEDVKDDLLLDVNVVTVGEQNDNSSPPLSQDSSSQTVLSGSSNYKSGSTDVLAPNENQKACEVNPTSLSASCSTNQLEIKEEEEEILVQRKEEGSRVVGKRNVASVRRGKGHLKRSVKSRRSLDEDEMRGTEPEKDSDGCQVVYQQHSLTDASDTKDEGENSFAHHPQSAVIKPQQSASLEPKKKTASASSVPTMSSLLEGSPEEQVVFELESVTTSVEEVMKSEEGLALEGTEENARETGQSPAIILERFLTSRQREAGEEEQCLMPSRDNQEQVSDGTSENEVVLLKALGGQEIKVEENIPECPSGAQPSQSGWRTDVQSNRQRGIRSVLVKQESSLTLSESQTTEGCRHIQWNVEEVEVENTPDKHKKERSKATSVVPELFSRQCIFYPVKEEEREVLLGGSQHDHGTLTVEVSSEPRHDQHTDCLPACDGLLAEERPHIGEYDESGSRRGEFGTEDNDLEISDKGEAVNEQQDSPQLRDFFLRGADEDDPDVCEFSDPLPDPEAEAMAYYQKSQKSSTRAPQPTDTSNNLSTIESQTVSSAQRDGEENESRAPIDYFSKYFGWDTWVDIAHCTNKLTKLPSPVTTKEVAQFIGIHIAMGTLKFPSLRLYWQALTKVPLIAEAMPVSRFLQLTHKLKLASPAEDPVTSVREERDDCDVPSVQQATGSTDAVSNCSSSSSQSPLNNKQSNEDKPNDKNCFHMQTDPLWRVRSLLARFKAGCQQLKREGDYGVDQCTFPLTAGKVNNNKPSLYCTTLVGSNGLILHLDLSLDTSNKESTVEKMVPADSMVFLCKQELSTPSMLEGLLAAGIHGAGRVGGARGQIGDEFVSSDGKLLLRRSHHGFILSTLGNGQRNVASVISDFEKALASAHLNRDLHNLYRIPLTASSPTCWPQAVLWYLIDLALVNSWLEYRQDHQHASDPLTFMAFRLEVSKALILPNDMDTQDSPSVPPQPPTQKAHTPETTPNPGPLQESPLPDAATRFDGSGHWPEQLAEGQEGRCRFGGCERTSRVLCLKCCVFLCISRNHNCFVNFHNQGSF